MASPTGRSPRRPAILHALETDQVRRIILENRTLYAIPDVLALLARPEDPVKYWDALVQRDPILGDLAEHAPFPEPAGGEQILPAADRAGLLRIGQSIHHPRAESLKSWEALVAAERLDEADNPELAIARARQEYQGRGYPRQWIDQRLRSISGRAEIVGEWHRRGARASDDYRTLTNALMQEAFSMDAETYRQHKGIFGRENLRDQMSEMELALLTLGENIGATLHRARGSNTLPELEHDMLQAGRIVGDTRRRIEEAAGRTVIEAQRLPPARRRNPDDAAPGPEGGREVLFRRSESSTK